MVLEILADTGEVYEGFDVGLFKECCWANTAKLQDLRGMNGACGEDNLFFRFNGELLVSAVFP